MTDRPRAVVFDLGGVLIDWNPRHLYRKLFDGDDEAMERFLSEVCTQAWNETMDAGRPFAEAIEELASEHPDQADLVRAYGDRWEEMLGGVFGDSLRIVHDLRAAGTPVYALSNWSAETFPRARRLFPFLDELDGVVISGEIEAAKPDPRAFVEFLGRFSLQAGDVVFVDDSPANVAAAQAVGMHAIRFEDAAQVRRELAGIGFTFD